MAMQNRYRSADRFTTMITNNGRHCVFREHICTTSDPELIAYLDSEVKAGTIYVDEGQETVDVLEPVAAIEARIRAKMLEEQRGKQGGETNGGVSGLATIGGVSSSRQSAVNLNQAPSESVVGEQSGADKLKEMLAAKAAKSAADEK